MDNNKPLPTMTIESMIFTVEQNLRKDLEFHQTQLALHKAKGETEEAEKYQLYISQINNAIYENNFKKVMNLKLNMMLSKIENITKITPIPQSQISENMPTDEQNDEKQNNVVTASFGGSKDTFKVSLDLDIEIPSIALKNIPDQELNDFIIDELSKIIKDKLKTNKMSSKTSKIIAISKIV